jgi:hypothetical protein
MFQTQEDGGVSPAGLKGDDCSNSGQTGIVKLEA